MPTLDSKNGLHRLDDEELEMLDNGAKKSGLLNGSNSAPNNVYEREQRTQSSPSQRRIPLFERASARWWNPQFASPTLETQYWKISFPLLRDRFRSGLIYILLTCILWMVYLRIFQQDRTHHWVTFVLLFLFYSSMLWFTSVSLHYQRFYLPTSFFCTFVLCVITLFIASMRVEPLEAKTVDGEPGTPFIMGPVASMATAIQVILLVYTVIPLPFYLCIIIGISYSIVFEILVSSRINDDVFIGAGIALHICIHLLGIHLFILTQVRQRKTFLKVGQSLLARRDLEIETQFKDHMIQSVMPKKVADELLKETSELRRPSASKESTCRTSNTTGGRSSQGADSTGGGIVSVIEGRGNTQNSVRLSTGVPNFRKFRPFTMNLMSDVSILFADIAGFTKMSANKSADELVNLLTDLFGRFDYLCGRCNLEKIGTLGDCYYCVAGCPEPSPDHAKCCVEMGLAMIVAIRQFDLDRGQEVNMRVGIHTGKVMCGMVGTKRFKFDVFSNDVTLANEMESTGVAGRVHISDATAKFLDGNYILEESSEHNGMKTWFIAGRVKEPELSSGQFISNPSDSDSARDITTADSRMSLKMKLVGKLKTLQTASLPIGNSETQINPSFCTSASLRMRILDRVNNERLQQITGSAQILDQSPNAKESQDETARKSASLQALNSNVPPPFVPNNTPVTTTNLSSSMTESKSGPDSRAWNARENIGGKFSEELASSINNSIRGSRSSGLQDLGSEAHSSVAIDTAISHHHNAASLTRFDTDHKDFDQRLAQAIHGANGAKGFSLHQKSLNRWTLNFKAKDVECEYRAHFAAESTDYKNRAPKTGVAKHHQLTKGKSNELPTTGGSTIINRNPPRYRYSGVFIDIVVSAIIFAVSAFVFYLGMPELSFAYVLYVIVASHIYLVVIGLIGYPLLTRRSIFPCMNLWTSRHLIGCMLIVLPVGVALFNIPSCFYNQKSIICLSTTEIINQRLLYSLVMLIALYAHCNFSQLGAWPKTAQSIVVAFIFVLSTWFCQHNIDQIKSLHEFSEFECNTSELQRTDAYFGFGSQLFIWELVLDILLVVILVAFLNYQFETAFRMSFFGDVQAKRDTAQMQKVRDEADWLLTNIIPQHAVESLKVNTRYSENHRLTAVLFASITNWNEMYEEHFQGGREYLRVLNEIIGDFDELLDRPEFSHVEKIKTIGSTYMAASGLNPDKRRQSLHPYEHLYQLLEFAIALQNALAFFNQDMLNFDFICKIGLNIGPVTAGVIGTTKLYYDIWGDTVNIASRMYSTGIENRIQVSSNTRDLLKDRYNFDYRDHIDVKGVDGGMDTYLLIGRKGEPPLTFPH